ncbi:MAG: DUF262 domain-containing HNH endonuclease family protein [Candidatus Omnitrophota bacterium]|nr:DUF262 domain-containing HNH endonuclease family protein [Candidatus Omnitrophota bacterium]
MKKNLLDTKTASWGELIKNGRTFMVPRFQRDYSWEEEQWDDLWYDLVNLEEEDFHYMGYLVLQNSPTNEYLVIDGQQRLTTLSIIALAVIQHIAELIEKGKDHKNNEERKKLLMDSFLGYKDPASLVAKSKLTLNRNNNDFYQSYLLRFRKPTSKSKLKPSEKLLINAVEYFYEKIKFKFGQDISGEKLADFLDKKTADKFIFTFITVDNDLNAYKVFETLNSRGVRLSPTDLLKNYLFMVAAQKGETDIDQAERQWQSINNILGGIELTTYLRHFWNSRNMIARKQNLFKVVKNSITDADQAFALLDELENNAQLYAAFSQPEDELWKQAEQSEYIRQLKLFGVTQCYPLLLAAYKKFDPNEYARLLRCCCVIAFRYNVIGGLNPNKLEDEYSKTAQDVYAGTLKNAREIFHNLKSVYVIDEEFESSFAAKSITTKGKGAKLVRYILFSLENQISNKKYDFSDSSVTIEHILPENPSQSWESNFTIEEQIQFVFRLGNYALLEESKNKMCQNDFYPTKKEIYKTSSYKITAQDSVCDEWNPERISERQKKLAKYAKTVWKFE